VVSVNHVVDRFEAKLHWEMLGPMRTPASSSQRTIIDLPAKEGSMTPNIADIIRQHVTLSVSCIDRLYLHAYMPKLQTSGACATSSTITSENPIPSPALFRPMHDRFLTAVETFARQHRIPTVEFKPGQRKDDIVADCRRSRNAVAPAVKLLVDMNLSPSWSSG
jgi:hypothetical protein